MLPQVTGAQVVRALEKIGYPVARQRGSHNWTEAEYWDLEERSEVKHEFINGQPYVMSDGTYNHTTICGNVFASAKAHLRGKPCRVRTSEQKVKSEKSGNTFYPDAVIFCPPSRFIGKGDHTLLTPTVIFEVLSPTTEATDGGGKFAAYRQIDSLTDYVLIEPERVFVDHYRRTLEGWLLRDYTRRDDVLRFPDLDIELPLEAFYDELDAPEALLLLVPPQLRDDEDE